VKFLGSDGEDSLGCWVHDLYDGERMRPERGSRPGRRCANGTAKATSPGSIEANSSPARLN
jgi:hypothetical protein